MKVWTLNKRSGYTDHSYTDYLMIESNGGIRLLPIVQGLPIPKIPEAYVNSDLIPTPADSFLPRYKSKGIDKVIGRLSIIMWTRQGMSSEYLTEYLHIIAENMTNFKCADVNGGLRILPKSDIICKYERIQSINVSDITDEWRNARETDI